MLRKIDLALSAAALKVLVARSTKELQLQRRKIVFSQGEHTGEVFYIDRGAIKLTVTSKDGREAVIGLLGHGSLLAEDCIVPGQKTHSYSAETLSNARLMQFNRTGIVDAIKRDPDFAMELIDYLVRTNVNLQSELATAILYTSEKRLARALLSIDELFLGTKLLKIGKINQQTLADMIGTSRQRVNRMLKRFEHLGLISFKKGIEIHDSLRAFASRE
jgi:CRP/FNR family transcriptional regulator, cyclic AMP receptor protein